MRVPETALRIVRFLDAAATRANLALLNYRKAVGDYQLWGAIEVLEAGEVQLLYAWVAYDRHGQQIGLTSGKLTVVSSSPGGNFWDGVPGASLQAVANDGIAAVTKQGNLVTSSSKLSEADAE